LSRTVYFQESLLVKKFNTLHGGFSLNLLFLKQKTFKLLEVKKIYGLNLTRTLW